MDQNFQFDSKFHFELNDYLIRRHFKKYDLEGDYYDVLMDYTELLACWDSWYEGYLEYIEMKKHNGW